MPKQRKPKVVIVGGGPAGASCAFQLARRGAADVVLLDKSRYPRVKVCGSGLSPLALDVLGRLDLRDRFAARHATISGLRIEGRGGRSLRFVGGDGAWVVPRVELDHALVTAAESRGAVFLDETKATALLRDESGAVRGVRITSTGRDGEPAGERARPHEIEADLVVCADGAPSRFAIDRSPRRTISTLMGWWRGAEFSKDEAIMVWDRRLAGYYAWVFPEPDDTVNIGLTIPEEAPAAADLKGLFRALLDEYFGARLARAEQVGRFMGHPAVITNRVGPIAEPRTLFVGEAARLVMPGTVEGIGFALESGVHAADTIAFAFDPHGGFSRGAIARYQMATAARVLPKFWAGSAWAATMRSERARALPTSLVTGRARPLLEKTVALLVGDHGQRATS